MSDASNYPGGSASPPPWGCFDYRTLLIGAGGGIGTGVLTRSFHSETPYRGFIQFHTKKKDTKTGELMKVRVGGTLRWRIFWHIFGSMLLYSSYECTMTYFSPKGDFDPDPVQNENIKKAMEVYRGSMAGLTTGAVYGMRGLPGGVKGMCLSGVWFGVVAGLLNMHLRYK